MCPVSAWNISLFIVFIGHHPRERLNSFQQLAGISIYPQ